MVGEIDSIEAPTTLNTSPIYVTVQGFRDSFNSGRFSGNPGTGYIPEHALPGTTFAVLITSDVDPHESFSYQLVAGEGATDNDKFEVSGDKIRTAVELDYESQPRLSIRVRSTDQGGLSVEQVIPVVVLDEVESVDQEFKQRYVDRSFGGDGNATHNSFSIPHPDTNYFTSGLESYSYHTPPPQCPALPTGSGDGWLSVAEAHGSGLVVFSKEALARYTVTGALDSTFGNGGRLVAPFEIRAITVQADGKIVVIGNGSLGAIYGRFVVARYNSNGTLDGTFGEGGQSSFAGFAGSNGFHFKVKVRDDGKILIGSRTDGCPNTLSFLRLTARGDLDNSFSDDGVLTIQDFTDIEVDFQTDGSMIVSRAGYYVPYTRPTAGAGGVTVIPWGNSGNFLARNDPALVRYNDLGELDTTFGEQGIARLSFEPGTFKIDANDEIYVVPYGRSDGYFRDGAFQATKVSRNGQIDSSFTSQETLFIGRTPAVTRAVVQPDGKLLLAKAFNESSVILRRVNPDGSADNTFGDSGYTLWSHTLSGNPPLNALQLQRDGKILFVDGTPEAPRVTRFNANGTLDTGFGTNGSIVENAVPSEDEVTKMLVQPDGKILAIGRFGIAKIRDQNARFGLTRFNPDGTTDHTFGDSGKVSFIYGKASTGFYDARLQSDGKIVVVGTAVTDQNPDHVVMRFLPNGALDSSFGAGGIVTFDVGNLSSYGLAVEVDTSGRVIVAGIHEKNVPEIFVMRFLSNGSFDTSFNGTGTHRVPVPKLHADRWLKLAIQKTGKIIAVGNLWHGDIHSFFMARFNTDGTADNSFGIKGFIDTKNYWTSSFLANSLALQGDDKLLVMTTTISTSGDFGALFRFTSNGAPDSTFDDEGQVLLRGNFNNSQVAAAPNGKIYLVGNLHLYRLNPNGSFDTTFGNNGQYEFSETSIYQKLRSLVVQADGKVLLARERFHRGGYYSVLISRYTSEPNTPTPKVFAEAYVVPGNWILETTDPSGNATSSQADNGVLANDQFDRSAAYRVELVQPPRQGRLELASDGTFKYESGPDAGVIGSDSFTYRVIDSSNRASREARVSLRFSERIASRFQNSLNAADVNSDGVVSPLDILLVINAIKRNGGNWNLRSPDTISPNYVDVNGDLICSPIDILIIINTIRRRSSAQGEGEAVDAVFADDLQLDSTLNRRRKAR
jgi:uncharacterized delta-60 repeat protein